MSNQDREEKYDGIPTLLCISCPNCFESCFVKDNLEHVSDMIKQTKFNYVVWNNHKITTKNMEKVILENVPKNLLFSDEFGKYRVNFRLDIDIINDVVNLKTQVLTSRQMFNEWKDEGIIGPSSVFRSGRTIPKVFCNHTDIKTS